MRDATAQATNIIDALRLNDRELAALMARSFDREADTASSVRRSNRYGIDDLPRMLVHICHQRGQCTTYLVKPRDIHNHGVVFLHGSFVHEGATCFIILRDRSGRPTQLSATVFRCRHISGRVHEVVTVFDKPICVDEYSFPDGTRLPAGEPASSTAGSANPATAPH